MVLKNFLPASKKTVNSILERLCDLQKILLRSEFFRQHEIVGSSLLIIYDNQKAGVWMIDFAKSLPLQHPTRIDHVSQWSYGNHEDGYLFGINNLISILKEHRDNIV